MSVGSSLKTVRVRRRASKIYFNAFVSCQSEKSGLKVKIYEVDKKVAYTIGTPETLRKYLEYRNEQ